MVMVREQNNEEIRTQILEKGQRQGSISYDEILTMIPDVERNLALLDDIMDDLIEAGIEVITEKEHQRPEAEPSDIADDFGMAEEDDDEAWGIENPDIVEDLGYQQALDTDDVVGLYLKEAGRVPLLSA